MQELDNVIYAYGIIVVYIYQIHHLIVTFICVSERVTNLEMWNRRFGLCLVFTNFAWWIDLDYFEYFSDWSPYNFISTYVLNSIGLTTILTFFDIMEAELG